MKRYILNLINEHKELVERINKLASFITSCNVDTVKEKYKDCLEDYVLMRIQLEHMNRYHDILSARLEKHGVVVLGTKYFEDVTEIKEPIPSTEPSSSEGKEKSKDRHEGF